MDFSFFYTDFPSTAYTGDFFRSLLMGLSLLLFIFLLSLFIKDRKQQFYFALIAGGIFAFKILIIFLNEHYRILPRKPAGNFVLWFYWYAENYSATRILEGRVQPTFLVQFLVNYPFIYLFGIARENVLLVNGFFTSMAAVYAFFGLKNIFGSLTAFLVLIFLTFYPAAINFSMFGLRDPVIYLFMTMNIVSLIRLYLTKSYLPLFGIVFSVLAIFSMRPELFAFLFAPYGFLILWGLISYYKNTKTINNKLLLMVGSFVVVILPGLMAAYLAYGFVTANIGAVGASPVDIVTTYASNRYDREAGIGDGSHIVPPNIYHAIPWYARWGLQALGMIILPFPWLITSVPKVFAAVDSFFIILMIVGFWWLRKKYLVTGLINVGLKRERIFMALFITFFTSVGVMGFIVNNAGNAFRMRMAIFPYIAISTALLLATVIEYRQKNKNKLSA
ncbi:hypothetical protein [Neolewinella agarilytica]|uniref:Glycosyltransferase RgtA/B/C/D-like domain-containing protein n=1 Tax=Neolewinella agarilytica TaxID=478744 RepID=A0A1H9DYK7_9BACT|nr:hypothetical protein [Neolewinella agarilytica]SEQ18569.1 hypothetical protein SAMN05444359_106183 [Neolewinella agarilytica]